VISVNDALGRVCGESIAVYPPGIPALLPGERITDEIIDYLQRQVAQGARLHGASDHEFKTIHVLPVEKEDLT
jgi:lysine decarboxylase